MYTPANGVIAGAAGAHRDVVGRYARATQEDDIGPSVFDRDANR